MRTTENIFCLFEEVGVLTDMGKDVLEELVYVVLRNHGAFCPI